ncbi:MAG TPA: hypothetical protein VEG30_04845 [Terriglobales bacterium]|nr:hypothetical protein [Terriglobales bacterium]
MRTILLLCLAVVCLYLLSSEARALENSYQTATLIEARRTQAGEGVGGDCFVLAIRLRDIVYFARQCALFSWNSYAPYEFTENGEVEVRLENDKIFLRRPNGKELKTRVVRRVRVPQEEDVHTLWRTTLPAPQELQPASPASPSSPASGAGSLR